MITIFLLADTKDALIILGEIYLFIILADYFVVKVNFTIVITLLTTYSVSVFCLFYLLIGVFAV